VTAVDLRIDHLDIALRYAAAPEEWPVAPRFSPTERWYHRLAATDHHEAWLLTWLPGQGTGWHDHGGSAGAFLVVSGQLREDTVGGSRQLVTGSGRRFGSQHVHRVVNDGALPAISLHVYSPALTSMTRYDMVGGSLVKLAVEKAGADW